VFPASAGMNRGSTCRCSPCSCVPREPGDEPPGALRPRAAAECSPRARG